MSLWHPSMPTSIGPPRDKSPPSRIKAAVDHAGPSALLVSLNHGHFPRDKLLTSLNSNWLIAHPNTEMRDATEDSTMRVLPTLRTTASPPLLTIPTLLRLKLARRTEEPSKLPVSPLLKDAPTCKTPSKADPLVCQLMLLTGADILQEFKIEKLPVVDKTTAVATLTTTSSWSDLPQPTTRSRTLGEHLGENKDSSDSPSETPAVSVMTSHLGSNDSIPSILSYHSN